MRQRCACRFLRRTAYDRIAGSCGDSYKSLLVPFELIQYLCVLLFTEDTERAVTSA